MAFFDISFDMAFVFAGSSGGRGWVSSLLWTAESLGKDLISDNVIPPNLVLFHPKEDF